MRSFYKDLRSLPHGRRHEIVDELFRLRLAYQLRQEPSSGNYLSVKVPIPLKGGDRFIRRHAQFFIANGFYLDLQEFTWDMVPVAQRPVPVTSLSRFVRRLSLAGGLEPISG